MSVGHRRTEHRRRTAASFAPVRVLHACVSARVGVRVRVRVRVRAWVRAWVRVSKRLDELWLLPVLLCASLRARCVHRSVGVSMRMHV